MNKWIKNNGECRYPWTQLVEVKFKDGSIFTEMVGSWDWSINSTDIEDKDIIIEYRKALTD